MSEIAGITVLDPATGRQIGAIEDMGERAVDRAVARARAAFDDGGWWPLTPDDERGRVLASPYGLAAAVWTSDVSRALSTARAIRAGVVWINDSQVAPVQAPWGGFKESGIGRELGPHGLHDYVEAKHIYLNHA